MFVLLTYDVNADRCNKMRRLIKKYLGHEQNSVFYGELTEGNYIKLKKDIDHILQKNDHILAIVAANRNNVIVEKFIKHDNNIITTKEDTRHKDDFLIL